MGAAFRCGQCQCLGRNTDTGCTPSPWSERVWHASWASVFPLNSRMRTSWRTTAPSHCHPLLGGAASSPRLRLPQRQPACSCLAGGADKPCRLFDRAPTLLLWALILRLVLLRNRTTGTPIKDRLDLPETEGKLSHSLHQKLIPDGENRVRNQMNSTTKQGQSAPQELGANFGK